MAPTVRPVEERFWDYISPEPNGGCWLWTSTVVKGGYGQIGIRKRRMLATHLSLMLHGRPRPASDALACHHCDVPLCVNPDHLYWGTNSTNQNDAFARGRKKPVPPGMLERIAQTHCKRGHPFAVENTYLNRGRRVCRACRRLYSQQPVRPVILGME